MTAGGGQCRPRVPGPWLAGCLVIPMLALGCGMQGGGDGAATRDALQSLAAGQAALAEGRTQEARDAFQAAVRLGGLQPDFYCEAVALLGRCEATLGNLPAAAEALAILEQGDADTQRVAALRKLIQQRPGAVLDKPSR